MQIYIFFVFFPGVFTNAFLYKAIADQKLDFGPVPVKKVTPKAEPANSA